MLFLLETPAGFGVFRLKNEKLVDDADSVFEHFADEDRAAKAVSLQAFSKFKDTKTAVDACASIIEGRLGKSLKKFLTKTIVDTGLTEQLAVCEKTLAGSIKSKLGIDCVFTPGTQEVLRGIRSQMFALVDGLSKEESHQMTLGLSHSMARFKLKFSPDKVDTMVVQAIGLLDDIDKELNNFAMRLREWYGWHFPELTKVVSDNMVYAQVVKAMGMKTSAKTVTLDGIIPEEILLELRKAAETSMGMDITEEDLTNIQELCDRVVDLSSNRASLSEYLKQRMAALAPNLTTMVGELVGARLISKAGSLMNLAKAPASTLQILGAEKALFRALKQKKQTPKYGLIYHASLVMQAQPKVKGKMSRVLAAKLALCSRMDALGDDVDATLGEESKDYVERRLQCYESGCSMKAARAKTPVAKPEKVTLAKTESSYNADADAVEHEMEEILDMDVLKKDKKAKKEKKRQRAEEEAENPAEEPVKKKKKKSKAADAEA